jgi:hypothetical protein
MESKHYLLACVQDSTLALHFADDIVLLPWNQCVCWGYRIFPWAIKKPLKPASIQSWSVKVHSCLRPSPTESSPRSSADY